MEELEAQPTPEPVQSMDDFMGEQFDAMEEAAPVDAAPVTPTPSDETPKEPEIEASADDGVDPEPDSVVAPKAAPDADKPEGDEPAEQTITAPQSMSAKDRETFYSLPPEEMVEFAQSWLSDRAKEQESSLTKKSMDIAERGKTYDKLEQIIAPRRQQLAMDGMDESTAVGQLFALSDFANKDPLGFTRYLLGQRGIPLSALNEPGGQAPADPQLQAIMNEVNGLKSSLTQQQTQAQDVAGQAISSSIEEFANDKANSFYGELEADMIPIVASLRQSQPGLSHKDYLAKGYKAALALNPEVSAKVAADNKAKTEAARIAKAKTDAAKAKKAAGARTKTGGALSAGAAKATDVDDFIGALVDERSAA